VASAQGRTDAPGGADRRDLGERAFARGRAIGILAAGWTQVVGPRLAAASAPVSLDGGILVIAASSGPWGAQVRFLAREILENANAALGAEEVRRVQVVVRPEPQKGL
jgi:predicted nucleic acid-binding Zn ribbon protein